VSDPDGRLRFPASPRAGGILDPAEGVRPREHAVPTASAATSDLRPTEGPDRDGPGIRRPGAAAGRLFVEIERRAGHGYDSEITSVGIVSDAIESRTETTRRPVQCRPVPASFIPGPAVDIN